MNDKRTNPKHPRRWYENWKQSQAVKRAERKRLRAEEERRRVAAEAAMRDKIARARRGELDTCASASLRAKRDELVHLEIHAALLKHVTRSVDDYLYGGKKRVKRLEIDDDGIITITSQRVVFLGSHRTVEIPYRRLMGLQRHDDALSLQVSGRVNTVVIQVDPRVAELAGLTVQAALDATEA